MCAVEGIGKPLPVGNNVGIDDRATPEYVRGWSFVIK